MASVLAARNIELRRAGTEIFGWARILTELDAECVDSSDDAEIGELLSVKLPDLDRRQKFLRVRCGTGRVFVVCVPPDIDTAIGAQSWMVGKSVTEFQKPEIRT